MGQLAHCFSTGSINSVDPRFFEKKHLTIDTPASVQDWLYNTLYSDVLKTANYNLLFKLNYECNDVEFLE